MRAFLPVFHVVGILIFALGLAMALPMLLELLTGGIAARAFLLSAAMTMLCGALIALAADNGRTEGLSLQATFLLTTGVWLVLPIFGMIPFLAMPDAVSLTDAFFEAMSGLTTTGSTVLTGLDELPQGVLLWRSMLQWFGGVGIVVVAMVFLPELRVGGMQIFRSEGFDTMGKILPRAAEISQQIGTIYLTLTIACLAAYAAAGMSLFDALNHALTTVATGGYSTHDASFGHFGSFAQWVAILFMLLASLPFVRYVQLLAGSARPLTRDPQIRGFVLLVTGSVGLLWVATGWGGNADLVTVVFNTVSLASGTGYASTDYQLWGSFAVTVLFLIGLVGGCAGSTCCSIKIFRWQILLSALMAQLKQVQAPHGIFTPRFGKRRVSEDVLSSVMAFFMLFLVCLGCVSLALALTGLDLVTAVTGAAAALANIGPGFGDIIGPAGNFEPLNDTAKWVLSLTMLLGRLEILAVFALFTRAFWQM